MAAIAVAPTVGFWIYRRGWVWFSMLAGALNLQQAAGSENRPYVR